MKISIFIGLLAIGATAVFAAKADKCKTVKVKTELNEVITLQNNIRPYQAIKKDNKKQLLVFAYNKSRERERNSTPPTDKEAIYIINTDKLGRNFNPNFLKRISGFGGKSDPVFSADGKKVAYIYYKMGRRSQKAFIVISKIDGSGATVYKGNYEANRLNGLSWSPDGKMLTFSGDNTGIAVLNIAAKSVNVLSEEKGESVSWSPKGDKIAFMTRKPSSEKDHPMKQMQASNDADWWILNILDVKTGKIKSVTNEDDYAAAMGPYNWTADGKFLLFNYIKLSKKDKQNRLGTERWIVEADGSNPKPLKNKDTLTSRQNLYPWVCKDSFMKRN